MAVWTNEKKANYEALWATTVLPWGLSLPWQWENTNDDIDNELQDDNL